MRICLYARRLGYAAMAAALMAQPPASATTLSHTERNTAIDAEVVRLMIKEDVKGLALAVIEGNHITHIKTYGYRNVEKQLPLELDTIMYGASLTKAAFAYMVLQLVDEGKIELDRSITDYLPKPLPDYERWESLKGQEQWRQLTPRILLNHASGLANLRYLEPDQKLKFHFKPGTNYAYSGEGFWILQTVLEQGLGLDVRAEMQKRIFDRFGMTRSDMQWRDDFAANMADGYAMDGSFEPHDRRDNVSASGSMDTTIMDQAKLWQAMLAGKGLSKKMRAEWIKPTVPIRSVRKFPTIDYFNTHDPRGEAIKLSAALGVETWQGPNGQVFEKGGHNDWTGNVVICQEQQKRCLVMLSNSVRAEIIYPALTKLVLGETNFPWWWTYSELHNQPAG